MALTVDEIAEQHQLRQQYLQEIRGQIHAVLTNLKVVDENGMNVTPKKLKILQLNQDVL